MRKRSVRWSVEAERDLEDIVDFLLTRSPDEAESVWKPIRGAASRLESLSERGRVVPELRRAGVRTYRELIVRRRYRLLYRASPRSVLVVAVLDGRRDLEEVLLARFRPG